MHHRNFYQALECSALLGVFFLNVTVGNEHIGHVPVNILRHSLFVALEVKWKGGQAEERGHYCGSEEDEKESRLEVTLVSWLGSNAKKPD